MIYNLKQIAKRLNASKHQFRLATSGQWTNDRSDIAVGTKCLFQISKDAYEFATLELHGVNFVNEDETLGYEFVTSKGDTLHCKFIPFKKLQSMLKAFNVHRRTTT